jgi:hypothetical protein
LQESGFPEQERHGKKSDDFRKLSVKKKMYSEENSCEHNSGDRQEKYSEEIFSFRLQQTHDGDKDAPGSQKNASGIRIPENCGGGNNGSGDAISDTQQILHIQRCPKKQQRWKDDSQWQILRIKCGRTVPDKQTCDPCKRKTAPKECLDNLLSCPVQ